MDALDQLNENLVEDVNILENKLEIVERTLNDNKN